MHTPGYHYYIPVAFISDIVLSKLFEFPRFKRPKDKASMTLLHYVVSRPAAHPFRWHSVGTTLQSYTFLTKYEQKMLKIYIQPAIFGLKTPKSAPDFAFFIKII